MPRTHIGGSGPGSSRLTHRQIPGAAAHLCTAEVEEILPQQV
jgi:hypothetical protein